MHYFSIFFKNVNKPWVKVLRWLDEKRKLLGNFERFLMKILYKNGIFICFGKVLTKNRALRNNKFFKLNKIVSTKKFSVSGGGDFPLSPWLPPLASPILNPSASEKCKVRIFENVCLVSYSFARHPRVLHSLPAFPISWNSSKSIYSLDCQTVAYARGLEGGGFNPPPPEPG